MRRNHLHMMEKYNEACTVTLMLICKGVSHYIKTCSMGTLVSKENGNFKKSLIKIGLDALFFIALVLPVAIFNLTNVVQPSFRGFFCSDNTIRYPYRGNTVPSLTLFLLGVPLVIVVTGLIEFAYFKLFNSRRRGVFHPIVVALYRVFGYFIIGATINQILTDTGKLTVGRLRPMFLDVCQPSVHCNNTIEHVYNLDYTCTRTEYPGYTDSQFQEMLQDIRKSFPSGHSSFSMYCAVFGVIYLQLRLKYRMVRMLKICCQTFVMAAAIWCCCTRYIDNKHHPTDIVAGAVLGTVVGIFAVFLYYRSLTYTDRKSFRRNACSRTPSSVTNRSISNSRQVEGEANGNLQVGAAPSVKIQVDQVSSM